jgi:hypothetical protein
MATMHSTIQRPQPQQCQFATQFVIQFNRQQHGLVKQECLVPAEILYENHHKANVSKRLMMLSSIVGEAKCNRRLRARTAFASILSALRGEEERRAQTRIQSIAIF